MIFDQAEYWIARHKRLQRDPRSVGNLAVPLEANVTGERELQQVAAVLAQMFPAGSVLDIGCGYGRVAHQFIANGHRYTGIDISPDAIAHAKAHPVVPGSPICGMTMPSGGRLRGARGALRGYRAIGVSTAPREPKGRGIGIAVQPNGFMRPKNWNPTPLSDSAGEPQILTPLGQRDEPPHAIVEHPAGSFICCDLLRWQPPHLYDIIVAFYVFVHFVDDYDWQTIVENALAWLAPNGVLVMADAITDIRQQPVEHVVARPLAEYREIFARRGYQFDEPVRARLIQRLPKISSAAHVRVVARN